MKKRITEFSDRRVWDLSGTILHIRLDYQVTLVLGMPMVKDEPQSTFTVVIEQPFTLRIGRDMIRISPGMVLSVVPLLTLLQEPLVSLTAYRDGKLLILFEEGAEIELQKDNQYESWNTFGEGEFAGVEMLCSGHDSSPWGG